MAQDTQEDLPSEAQSQSWDMPQYEAALAHLERLQEQLDGLRSTITSLVAPLARPEKTKAQMFANVRQAAVQSTDDLKAFREQWTSQQTQQVLARIRESAEKDGDLTKANDVAKYGWRNEGTVDR